MFKSLLTSSIINQTFTENVGNVILNPFVLQYLANSSPALSSSIANLTSSYNYNFNSLILNKISNLNKSYQPFLKFFEIKPIEESYFAVDIFLHFSLYNSNQLEEIQFFNIYGANLSLSNQFQLIDSIVPADYYNEDEKEIVYKIPNQEVLQEFGEGISKYMYSIDAVTPNGLSDLSKCLLVDFKKCTPIPSCGIERTTATDSLSALEFELYIDYPELCAYINCYRANITNKKAVEYKLVGTIETLPRQHTYIFKNNKINPALRYKYIFQPVDKFSRINNRPAILDITMRDILDDTNFNANNITENIVLTPPNLVGLVTPTFNDANDFYFDIDITPVYAQKGWEIHISRAELITTSTMSQVNSPLFEIDKRWKNENIIKITESGDIYEFRDIYVAPEKPYIYKFELWGEWNGTYKKIKTVISEPKTIVKNYLTYLEPTELKAKITSENPVTVELTWTDSGFTKIQTLKSRENIESLLAQLSKTYPRHKPLVDSFLKNTVLDSIKGVGGSYTSIDDAVRGFNTMVSTARDQIANKAATFSIQTSTSPDIKIEFSTLNKLMVDYYESELAKKENKDVKPIYIVWRRREDEPVFYPYPAVDNNVLVDVEQQAPTNLRVAGMPEFLEKGYIYYFCVQRVSNLGIDYINSSLTKPVKVDLRNIKPSPPIGIAVDIYQYCKPFKNVVSFSYDLNDDDILYFECERAVQPIGNTELPNWEFMFNIYTLPQFYDFDIEANNKYKYRVRTVSKTDSKSDYVETTWLQLEGI